MENSFKTEFQRKKEQKEAAIFHEYNSLISVEGRAKTEVMKYLSKKYEIGALSTIYSILKRVEKRIKMKQA